jgi:hypothetical protein
VTVEADLGDKYPQRHAESRPGDEAIDRRVVPAASQRGAPGAGHACGGAECHDMLRRGTARSR